MHWLFYNYKVRRSGKRLIINKLALLYVLLLFVFSFNSYSQQMTTQTFNFTGGPQYWEVPWCVQTVQITVAGAKGGGNFGGNGATVTGNISVTPGMVLQINVGGLGGLGTNSGGWNGGGTGQNSIYPWGNYDSGGGGGASDIRTPPYNLNNRIVVAAGGGGTGSGDHWVSGGAGGCAQGVAGTNSFGWGGGGGTQWAGGNGGAAWIGAGNAGQPGSLGSGGAGGSDPCYQYAPGAGGGGGYYGGGGGGSDCFTSGLIGGGGGGGGSSLSPPGTNCTQGNNSGHGYITLVFEDCISCEAAPTNTGPYCAGETIQLFANSLGILTYQWTGPAGFTSSLENPTIPNATVNNAGTYTLIISGPECSETYTTNVVVHPLPNVNATNTGPYCQGNTIYLSTPHVSGATYSWVGPGGWTSSSQEPVIPNATTAYTGEYTVTVTAPTGCTNTSTTSVLVSPQPQAVPTNTGPYCVGDEIILSTPEFPGANYSWSGPDGWTSNIHNPTRPNATFAMAGTYHLTVSIAGCVSSANTSVVVLPAPNANATNTGPYCSGDNIQLNTPGIGGATYQWSGPGGWTASTNNPSRPNATEAMAGTYTVTVTNQYGCENVSSTNVLVVDTPMANATNTGPYCMGDTIFLSTPFQPGVNYIWSGPGGFMSYQNSPVIPNASASHAGTYNLFVMLSAECTNSSSTSVSVNPNPQMNLSVGTHPLCNGENSGVINVSITTGSPNFNINWGTGSTVTSQTNYNISNLTAGTYNVTVTDNYGCSVSAPITLVDPPELASSVVSLENQNCQTLGSATVSASGGTPGYTCTWPANAGGVSGCSATQLTAGNYFVTITDSNNCEIVQEVSIIDIGAINATSSIIQHPACFGQSTGQVNISISEGNAPYSINWGSGSANTSQENYTITGLNAGAYTVTVTDSNGCTDLTSFVIIHPSQLTAGSSATSIACHGDSSTVTVSANGGTTPYTGTGTFTVTAGNYQYTVTDANGCTANTSVNITEPAVLIASYTTTDILCYGQTSQLVITATGGTTPYSGTGTFNIPAGSHQYTITDANGCTDDISFTITEPSQLTSQIISLEDQNCQTLGSATVGANGGTPGYSCVWPANAGGVSGCSATQLSAGTYNVTITDNNGCEVIQSLTVVDIGAIGVSSQVNAHPLCYGETTGQATITISGGNPQYDIDWGTGSVETAESSYTITGLAAGTYVVTATDINGCQDLTTFVINQPPQLTASSSATSIACYGDSSTVTVTASGGTTPYSGTGTFTEYPGTHQYTITDANGCTATTSVTITQPSELVASFTNTDIMCFGETSQLVISATGGTTPYTGTGTFNIPAGTHQYTITDANGCTDSIELTVTQPEQLTSEVVSTVDQNCQTLGSATVGGIGGTPGYTCVWPANAGGVSGCSANQLTAGSYNVTITDNNGCVVVQSVTIADIGAINASSQVIANPSCYGESTGQATINISGGDPDYNVDWGTGSSSTSQTSYTITGLAAGTYQVTVTDSNGCLAETTFVITQPPQITASSSATNINCYGGTATITVTASGGTSPYTGTGNFSVSAGNYQYTVTDANGCTATTSITVTQPNQLVASYTYTDILCYGENSQVVISATGGTTPYTGTGNFSVPAGTHNYLVTDANGCTDSVGFSVTQPEQLSSEVISLEDQTCQTLGSATVGGIGGTPGYSCTWPANAGGVSGCSATQLSAGTYQVTITDNNGCEVVQSLTVADVGAISVSSSVIQHPLCYGDSTGQINVQISSGTPQYEINWGSGSTLTSSESYNITGLTAGTYNITVTDGNGCVSNTSTTLQGPTQLIVNASVTSNYSGAHVSCYGYSDASVVVNAQGGTPSYSYLWGPNTGNATTQEVTGIPAGAYNVTVTDSNGCSAATSVVVTQPAEFSAAASITSNYNGFHISCYGMADASATVAVTGGSPQFSYLWSASAGSQNTAQAVNLPPGQHTVTVTDANNCQSETSVTITQPDAVAVNVSTNNHVSCHGGSDGSATAITTGGTGTYYYSWNDPSTATTQTASQLPVGNWTVTVSDQNNCTASGSVTITQPTEISISFQASDAICHGDANGSAVVNVSGGTPGYIYLWNDPSSSTDSTINNVPAGTYTVIVTDNKGCQKNSSVIISQPQQVSVNISTNHVICGNSLGSAVANATGGHAGYSYQWSTGAVSPHISGLSRGPYTVTVTDNQGCTGQSSTYVNTQGQISASISVVNAISCFGEADGIITASSSNGSPPYEFNWSTGNTANLLQNIPAGAYTVTITDSWGCEGSASFTVNQPDEIKINLYQTNVSCFDGDDASASVSASGGTSPFTYVWSTGATGSVISGLSPGTYYVTATDRNGCKSDKSVLVQQPEDPLNIDLRVLNVTCYGYSDGSIRPDVIGGTSPYVYKWTFAEHSTSSRNIYNLGPGTYHLEITDDMGCQLDTFAVITQPDPIVFDYDYAGPSCKGNRDGYISFEVNGGVEPYLFKWRNNYYPVPHIQGLLAGNYVITIIDNNKCEVSTSLIILDEAEEECLIVPNAFTPDGDGINDTWIIENIELFPHAYIFVYNRWGQLVHEARGNHQPWDGTYKGKPLPTGTYIYFIQLFDGLETYKGTVTIIY